ncbi:peptidylprolyl isomerase [Amphibiibacter pelophylacis]|uniref:Peptidylprolyl isomerase n=1 Tax=Amphibiibacter pelophylacis TaxID=1799477 RepID=A0ACC6NYW6_9BURK
MSTRNTRQTPRQSASPSSRSTTSRSRRALLAVGLCSSIATLAWASPAQAQEVRLDTSAGEIVLQMDAAKAPKTVANFLSYVKSGHYNGTVFHRVIADFMIQGGGFTPDFKEKPTRAPIALEKTGLSNTVGTVAMARTSDPDSASAQFFINVKDNLFLDPARSPDGNGYAVFGKVVKGMDVVNKIRAVRTTSVGPYQDVPAQPVIIRSASVVQ